ncbi:MAG: hypothetical protein FWG06_02890 [Clostridiales bacterium]|nr:hypothetical protein [Clostridiales bacterium]
MLVNVRIIGNLPYMVKGLQRRYDDLPLEEGARLAELLFKIGIKHKLLAFADGKRIEECMPLTEGMEITLVSPAAGG